jgi:L-threonylcarbamoyladenylate synthase
LELKMHTPTNPGARRAVFLDRDGTLIADRGHLRDPTQVEFFAETIPSLRRLNREFLLFIVTNQRGVADGVLDRGDVDRVNRFVIDTLSAAGVEITGLYVCPHRREDGCPCIKPNPFFLRLAEHQHGLDLARSFTVGDHPHDVEFARGVGACGIHVLTGHGAKHALEIAPDAVVAPDIAGAVDWILGIDHHGGLLHLDEALSQGGRLLRQGGIVAFPTETVYGLGANAFDGQAVAKVFEVKRRPRFDPLIVHIASREQLQEIAAEVPEGAAALAERFWPGPLTLVLPKVPAVPDIVTSGLPTVAVRVPAHQLARFLLLEAGVPVAGPSANLFGRVSPTTAAHVSDLLGGGVDAVIDGGQCAIGVESTIVSFVDGRPLLLRPGGLPREEVEAVVGPVDVAERAADRPHAPGMLARHYEPATPLVVLRDGAQLPIGCRFGLLRLSPDDDASGASAVETLSRRGDLREAATNLFAAVRRLDALGLDRIVARPLPDSGLGVAIMDRLSRASGAHHM